MKNAALKKYITLILFLVVTLGFTIGTHYILKPIVDKGKDGYGEVIEVNSGSVLTKQEFKKDGKTSMIYRVTGSGDYVGGGSPGEVITKLTINDENIIVAAEFEVYGHSDAPWKTKSEKFIESLVTNKQNILEFNEDLEFDGSTGATNSFNIIKKSIYGLTQYLVGNDVYGDIIEINSGSVLTKQELTQAGKKLTIYRVTGSGDYIGGGSLGEVITKLTINDENIIVAAEFEKYGHSDGSWKSKSEKFIESLVINKQNILEFDENSGFDGSTGATNSFNIIKKSIYGLTLYLKGDEGTPPLPEEKVSKYEELFGEDYQLTNELIMIAGDVTEEKSIIKRYDVTVNNKLVAYTYFVERIGQRINGESFGQAPKGSIEIQVITKVETSRILGFELDLDKYNHSTDEENLNKVLKHFDKIVDKAILAVNYSTDSYVLDGDSGASESQGVNNTAKLVQALLTDLSLELKKEYIFEEVLPINVIKDIDGVDTKVISSQIIKYNNSEYIIYLVEAEGIYRDGNAEKKLIRTAIVVDTTDVIVDAYFEIYDHSGGRRKETSYRFITSLVKKGQNIKNYELYDDIDGESKVTLSQDLISTTIYALRIHLTNDEPVIPDRGDVYRKLFGKNYKLENDLLLIGGELSDEYSTITRKDVIVGGQLVAYTYFVERMGVYITGGPALKSIEIQVITDPYTTLILGVNLDMDKYNHTHNRGDYKLWLDNYINKLIESEVSAIDYTGNEFDIDGETGSSKPDGTTPSNTVKLTMQMLEDLAAELKELYILGKKFNVNSGTVLTKQLLFIGEDVYNVYQVEASGIYVGQKEGKIITQLIIDSKGIIVSTNFIEYEHTTNNPVFYQRSLAYIASIIGEDINKFNIDEDLDGTTGATNSINVIRDSIFGLTTYLKGGSN